MMLVKETVNHLLRTICIIATTAYLLEGMRIGYQLFSPNCYLKNVNIIRSSASIGSCALLCSETSSCKGFVMKHGACGQLKTCPPCGTSLQGADGGWSVYCTDGKINNSVIT